MRKYLCLIFLLFFVLGFSQATNPVASDVSSAHFKDTDGLIHLVGSDAEYGVLTYTIVSLPSHGTLKDPLNGNAVVSAGGSLTGSLVTFTPHSDENHKYIFSGTNSFTYKVTDSGSLDSDVKTVTVKVYDEYLNPPTLIGTEIDGEAAGDNFGRSVSLSEDGMIMAVGAPYNNGNGEKAGSVRVYEFNGSDWDRYGTVDTQLEGASVGDYFGSSVSLSGDGTILAVGLPYRDGSSSSDSGEVRIFKYMSGSWVNIGTKIPSYSSSSPKNVSKYFGNDVRLSSDGKTLAVSDIWYSNIASDDAFTGIGGTNSGRVVVYRYDGSSWNSLGNEFTLYADAQNNNGWGLSLSADGNILAVGAHEDDTTAGNAGKVQVYQYDFDNNEWDTKGSALLGDSSNDKFGAAIDLNSSGLIIAVGSSYDRPDSLLGQGTVNVYGWNGTNYVTLGSEIKGLNKFDYFGAQLSLDNEGNSLVIMAPGHDDTSGSIRKYQGQVRIYNYDISSTSWVQSPGTDVNIEGEAINNQSADNNAESKGQRVFLSGDGSVLAIGADENDGNGTDSGHVRVYKLFEPQIIPVAVSQTVDFVLYEQVDSEDITLDGSDGDSGPSDLVYIITELNTARLIENGTPIGAIPHTLTGKVVKYNSNSDVVVNDTFKFIVHDGKASSIPATVTLTVTPDNDAPIAIDQDLTTDEDVAIDTITLSATDVDSPQGDMIYIIETLPTKGTLKEGATTITAAGTVLTAKDIIYTPNSNYSGADSFTFKVKDKGVGSDGVTDVETSTIAATISITVNNTDNDPPIAENKALSTEEETVTGTITLVATDVDDDDTTLVYTIASLPTDGTLKADGTAITAVGDLSGALTYTPNTDFVGDDTFTFTAKDDEGAVSNTATVTISVSNTNDPPVSQDKALSTEEETVT
ncbi:MAG: Ig-like domain-containing protein, partial [Flavobacteriales bacterium]